MKSRGNREEAFWSVILDGIEWIIKRRYLVIGMCIAFVLGYCSWAMSEVTLTGPDGSIETREPVDLVVGGIDNDDLLQTRVVYWPREAVRVRPILLWGGGSLLPAIEFYAKNPGKYLVSVVTPTANGLDYAEVVVQVEAPKIIPELAPVADPIVSPQPGHRLVTIIEVTEKRSPQEAVVMKVLMGYLKKKGHEWEIVDKGSMNPKTNSTPDWLMQYLKLIDEKNLSLPVIVVSVLKDGGGSSVVGFGEMSTDESKNITMVQRYGG